MAVSDSTKYYIGGPIPSPQTGLGFHSNYILQSLYRVWRLARQTKLDEQDSRAIEEVRRLIKGLEDGRVELEQRQPAKRKKITLRRR